MDFDSETPETHFDLRGRVWAEEPEDYGGFIRLIEEKTEAGVISAIDNREAFRLFVQVGWNLGLAEENDTEWFAGRYDERQTVTVLRNFLNERYPGLKHEVDLLYQRFMDYTDRERGGP